METEHDLPNPTVARILGREEEEHPMFFERDMLEYGERRARMERERCARLCEEHARPYEDMIRTEELSDPGRWEAVADGARACAAAIRKGE